MLPLYWSRSAPVAKSKKPVTLRVPVRTRYFFVPSVKLTVLFKSPPGTVTLPAMVPLSVPLLRVMVMVPV